MIHPNKIAAALRADGWQERAGAMPEYSKRIAARAAPGAFVPDGGRLVTLRLDPGAWGLSRIGPWGETEARARLGSHASASDAIAAALMP